MILKLARLIVKQQLPKATADALLDKEEAVVHVPRPVAEQTGRKKNPVRIIDAS